VIEKLLIGASPEGSKMDMRSENPQPELVFTATRHEPLVFKGLFQNPAYGDKSKSLGEDEQSKRTQQVVALASLINNKNDVSTLAEIFAVLRAQHKGNDLNESGFNTHTASQSLSEGIFAGCSDDANSFATLARAVGIPSIVVDGAKKEWVESGASANRIQGHFFVEVCLNRRWHLVDSTQGVLYENKADGKGYDPHNWCLPNGYLAFSKALSVIDVGATIETHNLLQRVAFSEGKPVYLDPKYQAQSLDDSHLRASMRLEIGKMHLLPDRDALQFDDALSQRRISASQAADARLARFEEAPVEAVRTDPKIPLYQIRLAP
jgi:hypothetical protein